jgi:hypothetical protein
VPKALIHIGTHKTGTTSFQYWCENNRSRIQEVTGFRYFKGMFGTTHIEFPLLCARPEREMRSRQNQPSWDTPEFQVAAQSHIRSELNGEDLIISAEDLSLLRYPDEVARLRELLDPYELTFLVVVREPNSFLASYTRWMANKEIEESADPDSFAYVGHDSWLLGYDRFAELFEGIETVQYEQSMSQYGSIIPGIMEMFGLDHQSLPKYSTYDLNSAETPSKILRRLQRLRRRLLR